MDRPGCEREARGKRWREGGWIDWLTDWWKDRQVDRRSKGSWEGEVIELLDKSALIKWILVHCIAFLRLAFPLCAFSIILILVYTAITPLHSHAFIHSIQHYWPDIAKLTVITTYHTMVPSRYTSYGIHTDHKLDTRSWIISRHSTNTAPSSHELEIIWSSKRSLDRDNDEIIESIHNRHDSSIADCHVHMPIKGWWVRPFILQ